MIAVYPKKAQLEALLASPESGPVVMPNLLRLKKTAPDAGVSGREAYVRYGEAMRKLAGRSPRRRRRNAPRAMACARRRRARASAPACAGNLSQEPRATSAASRRA
jgi:hypothetical protein